MTATEVPLSISRLYYILNSTTAAGNMPRHVQGCEADEVGSERLKNYGHLPISSEAVQYGVGPVPPKCGPGAGHQVSTNHSRRVVRHERGQSKRRSQPDSANKLTVE